METDGDTTHYLERMFILFQLSLLFLSVWGREEFFHKMKDTSMTTHVIAIANETVFSEAECSTKCLGQPKCLGFNYNTASQERELLSAAADTTGNKRNPIQWAKGKQF